MNQEKLSVDHFVSQLKVMRDGRDRLIAAWIRWSLDKPASEAVVNMKRIADALDGGK